MLGRGPRGGGKGPNPSPPEEVPRGDSSCRSGMMPLYLAPAVESLLWFSSPGPEPAVPAEKALWREAEVWGVVGACGDPPFESACWYSMLAAFAAVLSDPAAAWADPWGRPCGKLLWGELLGVAGAVELLGRAAAAGPVLATLLASGSDRAAAMSASRLGMSRWASSAAWRRHCTAAPTKQVVLSAAWQSSGPSSIEAFAGHLQGE